MSDRQEWLDNLKVGDKVLSIYRSRTSIVEITRFTKTQIICGAERFTKSGGNAVGSTCSYYKGYISELTEEINNKFILDKKHKKLVLVLSGPLQDKKVIEALYDALIKVRKE